MIIVIHAKYDNWLKIDSTDTRGWMVYYTVLPIASSILNIQMIKLIKIFILFIEDT